MSGLSLVVNNDTEQQEQGREYVKADTKNGFTQVANELLEYMCQVELSGRQYRVLVALIRKTYGYNKKLDWVVGEQIQDLIQYDGAVTNIHSDLRVLLSRNIVIKEGKKIGPNPILSEWVINKNKSKSITNKTNRNQSPHKSKSITAQIEINHKTDRKQSTQKTNTNTKDNITKDSKSSINLPSWLPSDLWSEFVAMRKSIKKPLTEQAIVRMINKLVKFHDQGIDAVAQLTSSIDNCYSDVYAPKNFQNNSFRAKSVSENFDNKDYGETQIPVWMQGADS